MKVLCNACGHGFEVPAGTVEVRCEKCEARITLTALETRPRQGRALFRAPESAPEERLGQVLGGYRLSSLLGGGGMGIVYEAERTEAASFEGPKVAAVKVLSPAFSMDPQFVERFRREADALTRLRHDNLIEVYARGEEAGEAPCYFFIMERFYGEDLRSLLSRGAVPPKKAAAIIRQAAAGLSYAHAQGIVHRDVKPANILVQGDPSAEGKVKVVDFGVAQLAASSYTLTSLTSSDLILGTINYMSPEQRVDASQIDHRADIYALGVVAYELLTGRLPIGAFEPPSQLLRTLSRSADRAVLSALRRDPAHRPGSVEDFAMRLERALTPANRRLWLAVAASLLLTGALGGMGLSALKPQGKAKETKLKVAASALPKEAPLPMEAKAPEPIEAPEVPELPAELEPLVKALKRDARSALELVEVPQKRPRKALKK